MISRRGLFSLLSGAAVVATTGELWTPSKAIFLPPRGGWVGSSIVERPQYMLPPNMDEIVRMWALSIREPIDRDVLDSIVYGAHSLPLVYRT